MNALSQYFGIHAAALVAREKRLEVIASNIANADTPGYKAKDMNFSSALSEQMKLYNQEQPFPRNSLNAHQMSNARLYYEKKDAQASLDGNTVDPDLEKASYGRAAMEYRATLSFFQTKIKRLMTAITGQ